jgi:Putative Actinobacterial Holin-X, holin superfamily III
MQAMADETDRGSAAKPYEPPVTELIREVLGDTGELVRIEVALARDELRRELVAARTTAIAMGTAAVMAVVALTMVMVALVLALKAGWVGALLLAAILLVAAISLGLIGWKAMPRSPLGQTKGRLQANVERLKERMA